MLIKEHVTLCMFEPLFCLSQAFVELVAANGTFQSHLLSEVARQIDFMELRNRLVLQYFPLALHRAC